MRLYKILGSLKMEEGCFRLPPSPDNPPYRVHKNPRSLPQNPISGSLKPRIIRAVWLRPAQKSALRQGQINAYAQAPHLPLSPTLQDKAINMTTQYKRILLKLSGESLMGNDPFGINRNTIMAIVRQVKEIADLGVQVGIVVGGGNIFRGVSAQAGSMDRATADYMGMMATVMNALALKDAFEIFEANTLKLDKWSQDTGRLVASVRKLLFLYFSEQTPVANITRDNLLEFKDILYKVPAKLAQKSKYKHKIYLKYLK